MLMLVGIAGTMMYVLCFTFEHQVRLLRAISLDLLLAGKEHLWMFTKHVNKIFFSAAFSGTIAVITFGALGDSRDWMPDFEHNYLSWSFGLGVVGTFGLYVSSMLFYIEAKVQAKKQMATTSQATFALEHKVWRTDIFFVTFLLPLSTLKTPSIYPSNFFLACASILYLTTNFWRSECEISVQLLEQHNRVCLSQTKLNKMCRIFAIR
jgi:hypothetical protein